ncbi:MAG: hypothetical protein IPO79_03995 [Flavobacteriales bacterium]|nr:hypothetical protein [Flavobacteriales bacterium]
MDIEDRVSFFRTHVATGKVQFEAELQHFLSVLSVGMIPAHQRMQAIADPGHESTDEHIAELHAIRSYMGHMVRYAFIHVFAQFDQWALLSLDVYGRIIGKDVSYADDTGGALRVLPQFLSRETASKLDPLKGRLEFYLTLRNQFAHYAYNGEGSFHMNAKQDSFESLVRKEAGIECAPSLHAFKQGKPGFFIKYTITSDRPLISLIEAAKAYYFGLLDEWMCEVMDAHGTTSPAP